MLGRESERERKVLKKCAGRIWKLTRNVFIVILFLSVALFLARLIGNWFNFPRFPWELRIRFENCSSTAEMQSFYSQALNVSSELIFCNPAAQTRTEWRGSDGTYLLFFDGSGCFDLLSAVDLRFPSAEILRQKSRLAPHELLLFLLLSCFCVKKFSFPPFSFCYFNLMDVGVLRREETTNNIITSSARDCSFTDFWGRNVERHMDAHIFSVWTIRKVSRRAEILRCNLAGAFSICFTKASPAVNVLLDKKGDTFWNPVMILSPFNGGNDFAELCLLCPRNWGLSRFPESSPANFARKMFPGYLLSKNIERFASGILVETAIAESSAEQITWMFSFDWPR